MNAQCNHCTLQSPIPHHPRPANFPTSRQVEKPTSWQVGKHRHLPLHHQPVPAAFLLHPADPAALACSRIAAKPPTLLPAALLFLLRPACHPYPRVNRPPATLAHLLCARTPPNHSTNPCTPPTLYSLSPSARSHPAAGEPITRISRLNPPPPFFSLPRGKRKLSTAPSASSCCARRLIVPVHHTPTAAPARTLFSYPAPHLPSCLRARRPFLALPRRGDQLTRLTPHPTFTAALAVLPRR